MWSSVGFYKFAMGAGAPVMGLFTNDKGALDAKSTWMPVVKGWTSTRDFDGLSKDRFRTWFKNHKPLAAEAPVQKTEGTEGGGE